MTAFVVEVLYFGSGDLLNVHIVYIHDTPLCEGIMSLNFRSFAQPFFTYVHIPLKPLSVLIYIYIYIYI